MHCGCIAFGAVVAATAALGWWWRGTGGLWIAGAVALTLATLLFVNVLLESRWYAVTAADRDRGVPGNCAECGSELSAIIGKTRYQVRCPICGHERRGPLRS